VLPVAATSFEQAIETTAEVYLAAGRLMADAGRLQGVADEGGYWPVFDSNEQALETLVRAIEAAGFVPGREVAISLDIAASEFGRAGRYRLGLESRELDSDGLCELLVGWCERYPIVSVEDPLAEDDPDGLRRFTAAVGERVQVIGDDFLVTSAQRVAEAAASGTVNAVLVKVNQAGTVTEAHAALTTARDAGLGTIVSARSGETEDLSIAHLVVGWDAGQFKVGSFSRSERMAKWNEMIRIESSMGTAARFAGRDWRPGAAAASPLRRPAAG
jgi:enolase